MDSEQLDRDLAELFARPSLHIDPDSDLNRALFLQIIDAPAAQLSGIDGATGHESDFEIVADVQPEPRRPRAFAFAAATVLFMLVGGLVTAIVLGRGEPNVETASASPITEAGFPWTPPPSEASSGLVRGPDAPQVVIAPSGLAGKGQFVEACVSMADIFNPYDMGVPALIEVGYVDGIDDLEAVLFADVPGLFSSCSKSGSGGSGQTGDRAALAQAPFLFESAETSEGGGPIEVQLEGLIADNVAELEVVGVDTQVFRTDGRYFVINYELPSGTSAPEFVDPSESDIRVFFDDGTEELHPLETFPTPEVDCGSSEECVLEQAELASVAGATGQFEVLVDGVLEQSEYAQLVGRFSACLDNAVAYPFPPSVSMVVPAGSTTANAVSECFDDELGFVERARTLQNFAWFETPEGIEYSLSLVQPEPSDQARSYYGSVLYLTDDLSEEALTEVRGEIRQLEMGAYRYIPAETTYRQFVNDFGVDNLAPLTIDPSIFPDRIEFVSNSDDLWSSELRQLQNLEQVESVLQPVTLNPDAWTAPLADGVHVVIASDGLLPEDFKPDGVDSPEPGEAVTGDSGE